MSGEPGRGKGRGAGSVSWERGSGEPSRHRRGRVSQKRGPVIGERVPAPRGPVSREGGRSSSPEGRAAGRGTPAPSEWARPGAGRKVRGASGGLGQCIGPAAARLLIVFDLRIMTIS